MGSSKRTDSFIGSFRGRRHSSKAEPAASVRRTSVASSPSIMDSESRNSFFSRSSRDVSGDGSMINLPLSRINTHSSTMSNTRNSVYTLSSSHAKKLAGTGYKHTHRHTLSDDFELDPPDSKEEIERMFEEVMASRDFGNLPEKARRQMQSYPTDRKWMLIRQHKLAEFKKQKMKANEMKMMKSPRKHNSGNSISSNRHSRLSLHSKPSSVTLVQRSEPSFYVGQLISNEITLKELKELDICLSSEELRWTRDFLKQEGALCLCNVLNNLYKTFPMIPKEGDNLIDRQREANNMPIPKKMFTNISEEYDSILEKEVQLFRCIKVIADLSLGIEYLKKSEIFIQAMLGGLFSCKPQVRKWATDILIYFYHKTNYGGLIRRTLNQPMSKNVHFRFLQRLYSLPRNTPYLDQRSLYILNNGDKVKRYEFWLWGVLRLFQGKGRMGSKVGAFQEFRYAGTITTNFLIDYALSTLLLMNTLIQKAGPLAERTKVRRMLVSAGLKDIFESFNVLQDPEVNHSMASMRSAEHEDHVELRQMEEFQNDNINFNDPVSLFAAMWKKNQNSDAGKHLLSMMQNMFVSQSGSLSSADPTQVARNLKLVDSFINNVTLATGDDDADMNISINKLLASYQTDQMARKAVSEAAEAKRNLEEAEAEKENAIQQLNEGSKGVVKDMKSEISERDNILRRLREKLDEKEKEVSELKRKRILDKHQQEMEMREMLLLLHSQEGRGGAGVRTRPSSISKDSKKHTLQPFSGRSSTVSELEKRLKTRVDQSKLESKRLGSVGVEPSAHLRDLRLKMDLLEREARDLENMDFEEFSEKIPEPPKKTENRKADVDQLAKLRKRLDFLQKDANKVMKFQGDMAHRENMQVQKSQALDRLTKLQQYTEDLRLQQLENSPEVMTLDPRQQSTDKRSGALHKELDAIELLCRNLKDKLQSNSGEANAAISSNGNMVTTGATMSSGVGSDDQADLMAKFENKYSSGKKVQPKADYSSGAVSTETLRAKHFDKKAMRPFLGELESKVTRMAPIGEVDSPTIAQNGIIPKAPSIGAGNGKMPLSIVPPNPIQKDVQEKQQRRASYATHSTAQKNSSSDKSVHQMQSQGVSVLSSQSSVPVATSSMYANTPVTATSAYAATPITASSAYAATSTSASSKYAATSSMASAEYANTPIVASSKYMATPVTTSTGSTSRGIEASSSLQQSMSATEANFVNPDDSISTMRSNYLDTAVGMDVDVAEAQSADTITAESSSSTTNILKIRHVHDQSKKKSNASSRSSMGTVAKSLEASPSDKAEMSPSETSADEEYMSAESGNARVSLKPSSTNSISSEEAPLGDVVRKAEVSKKKSKSGTSIKSKSSVTSPPPPPAPPLPAILGKPATTKKSLKRASAPLPPPPPPLPKSLREVKSAGNSPIPPPPPLPSSGSSGTPPPAAPPLPISRTRVNSIPSPIVNPGPFDMLPRPKKKLKQLHWEKLEDTEDSFWVNMGSEDIAKQLLKNGVFDEIEVIFAAKEAKKIARRKKEEENKISFLKTDVSQQFGICLHSFATLTDMQVVIKILHCDDDVLNKPALLDFLSKPGLNEISINLTKNFDPYSTDWQSGQISRPEKDPSELARADRIYLELIFNLHHYWRSRMRALNSMLNYERDYNDLVHKLEQIDTALDGLEKSDTLRRVFDIILIMGNYMNDTSKQALGFKLSSLQRLTFLKDQKNTFSFLHYVEKIVHKNYPDLETFVNDLKATFVASKISIQQLQKDCRLFVRTVKNIDSSLQNGNLSNPDKFHPEDRFLKVVLRRLPSARSKAALLDDRAKIVLERFDKVMRYFGEDPNADEFTRNSFFSKFSDFVKGFEKAAKENREMEERNRVYELTMQKYKDEKKKSLQDAADKGNKSDSSDMDKFLDQLRHTGPLRSEPTSAKIKEWAKKHSKKYNSNGSSASTSTDAPAAEDTSSDTQPHGNEIEEEDIRNRTHDLLMKLTKQTKGQNPATSPSMSTGDLQFRLSDFKLSDRMRKRLQQSSRASSMSSLELDPLAGSGSKMDMDTPSKRDSGSLAISDIDEVDDVDEVD